MLNHPNLPSRQGRAPRKAQRPQSFAAFLKCVLLALPFTVLLGAFVLSVSAFLLLRTANPIHYADTVALIGLYLTALLGGMLATRLYGRRAPVLCGLSTGILLLLAVSIPTLLLSTGESSAAMAIFTRLLIPFLSLAGAMFVARKRKVRTCARKKR